MSEGPPCNGGKTVRAITTAILGAALTTSASGQSIAPQSGPLSRPEGVVGVSLTIPFGGARRGETPRVELRLARDNVNIDGGRQSSTVGWRPVETRIGVSLAPDRKLLLNGRPIANDRRQGVSTVGWVAIGAGVAAVAGAAWVVNAMNEASRHSD